MFFFLIFQKCNQIFSSPRTELLCLYHFNDLLVSCLFYSVASLRGVGKNIVYMLLLFLDFVFKGKMETNLKMIVHNIRFHKSFILIPRTCLKRLMGKKISSYTPIHLVESVVNCGLCMRW